MLNSFRCASKESNENSLLSSCTGRRVTLGRKIGEGAFGSVFAGTYTDKAGTVHQVAIKRIRVDLRKKSSSRRSREFNAVTREVNYSHYVSRHHVSPRIFDSFYVVINDVLVCYIIMERYAYSVDMIYSRKVEPAVVADVHRKMIRLVHDQVFNLDMFCTDIKPENFVVKLMDAGYHVRSIDYSADWCSLGLMPNEFRTKDLFYVVMLIQLCLKVLLRIPKNKVKVLAPFYSDATVQKVTRNMTHFSELRQTIADVIESRDGGQVRHYFVEVLENMLGFLVQDPGGVANSIVFIWSQVYFSGVA